MKKIVPVFLAAALLISSCQLGGGQGAPTAIALPTVGPTLTPIPLNPTAEVTGGDVAAGSERVSPADGMIQVYIPPGAFQMGGLDPNADGDEKPVHRVELAGYWIDKVEVTNGMYLLCVQAGVCSPPQNITSESRQSYFNNPEFNDFPVVNVTWGSANQYCEWAGRRLPSEAEWERAARGDSVGTYPWGEARPDGTRANYNYILGDTSRVGSYPAGISPFGILDMSGNVNEWVNDYYDAEYYQNAVPLNPTGPLGRTAVFNRVLRGGSFADSEFDIRVADRASAVGPNFNADLGSSAYLGDFSPRIGFRCVSN